MEVMGKVKKCLDLDDVVVGCSCFIVLLRR